MEVVSVFKSKSGRYHETEGDCKIADLEYELKSYRDVLYTYMNTLSIKSINRVDADTYHSLLNSKTRGFIVDTLFTCKDTILGIYEKQEEYETKILELQQLLVEEKKPQKWWTGIYRKLKS